MRARVISNRVIFVVLAILLFSVLLLGNYSSAEEEEVKQKSDGDASIALTDPRSYAAYEDRFKNEARPEATIRLEGEQYKSSAEMTPKPMSMDGTNGVLTDEIGEISWEFDVKESGLYDIALRYYPVAGRNESIERKLLIDGESPFKEADRMLFPRIWGNKQDSIKQDMNGNDLRPSQVEKPAWRDMKLQDSDGYVDEPFSFYFTAGKHVLTLKSEREPMLIDYIEIQKSEPVLTYAEWEQVFTDKGYEKKQGIQLKIQGEQPIYTSSPTLYPTSDRSSPATEPYDVGAIRLNTIGGNNWRMPGQSITWGIEAPEDGLYKIAIKYRQNLVKSQNVPRRLTIDGKVPFKEASQVIFEPSSGWEMMEVGGEEEPYWFYLEKGMHQLTLEVTLGDMKPLLSQVESSILELNKLYRQIIMITGASPDPYRDYQMTKRIPDLQEQFQMHADKLHAIVTELERMSGGLGERTAVIQTFQFQLSELARDPESIVNRIGSFKNNIVALGTWILTAKELPLEVDYLLLTSDGTELPDPEAAWYEKVWHESKSFVYSFFTDYSSVGSSAASDDAVEVWITGGRDQAQVIKTMIETEFTPKSGIAVNLQLVDPSVMLPATLAGSGPDVALMHGEVVNFAIRDAIIDLSQFDTFEQVKSRFHPEAFVPLQFNGGIYAIPEQQTFPMLFYRKDVLDELGVEMPETWEDMYDLIPVLNKHHMNIGLTPQLTMDTLLFQNGGSYYEGDGIKSALDSEEAMQAFKQWTDLYRNYKAPQTFDFLNRFRVGEMPIGIADYTTYNSLAVFAPEIRGLWGFMPIPGYKDSDGKIHRETVTSTKGSVMFKSAKNKEQAWQFIDWWTSKEAQLAYGREMEAILGASGRYPTANLEALQELPWPVKDINALMDQMEWVRGVPDVPGAYSTQRHLNNAYFKVLNHGSNPRETLKDYVRIINQEITVKRREFGLPIAE
ncbi:extracellular solute-binding protein [Paenibacillus marinisediminis]